MRHLHLIPIAALTLAGLVLAPKTAEAAEDKEYASATGKGITGGVLLGAELVMLTEAAFRVKPAWAYAVGGIAGGAAGGVAGYFLVEKGCAAGDTCAKVSMYMLAGGMALIIPTTVAVLSAAAYEPPADYTEDKGPSDEPVAEPPRPGAAPPPAGAAPPATEGRRTRSRRVAKKSEATGKPSGAPALLGVYPTQVTLSVPAVEVREVYSRVDLVQYGVKQATEVRVPVFNFAF